MNWWEIASREFKSIIAKRPKLLLSMFVIPLFYMLLFGNLFSQNSIDHIPLVICDESQTYLSRELTQRFEDSDRFTLVAYVDSQEELEEYLYKKKTMVGVGIPKKFTRDVKTGLPTQVLIDVDGTNLMATNTVMIAAEEILGGFSKQVAVKVLESQSGVLPQAALHKISPVELKTRLLHNPTLDYQLFFLYGLLMTSFQMSLFIPNAISMLIEYKSDQYIKSKPFHVVLGKILPFWLAGTCAYGVLLTIAVTIFHLPAQGNALDLLLLGSSFVFAMTALSSLIISFFTNLLVFYRLAIASSVPIFIVSGFTWPLRAMPFLVQKIAELLPFTYFADNLRSLMLSGKAPQLYQDIMILLFYGAVMLSLSIYRYQKMRVAKQVKAPV